MPEPRTPRRPADPPRRRAPTSVLRAGPAEFAAALPELLGFPPVESLVLLLLGGDGRPERRLSLTLRLDLPAAELDQEVAREVVSRLTELRPSGALVFVVTEAADDQVVLVRPDPWRDVLPRTDVLERPTAPDLPRRALVHAVVDELSALGTRTADAVLVRADRWWSYLDVTAEGSSAGSPLDPVGSRLGGIAALRGRWSTPTGTRWSPAPGRRPPPRPS